MAVKIPQVVGNLPSPPNPADRSTFNTLAYPWSEALTPWTNEMNKLAADTYDNALDVQGASTVTGSDRDIALGAANAASVDAGLANGYKNEAFASKQSASTSAGLADASRSDAQTAALAAATWATSTTVVSGGNKGAKGYALDAAQSAADAASIVLGEVFDNTQESAVKGWTSSKIVAWFNGLTTTFTRTLLSRTNAEQARSDLGLGDAATKTVGTSTGNLMAVGAGGLLGRTTGDGMAAGYPATLGANIGTNYRRETMDGVIDAFSASIHIATADTWGRVRIHYDNKQAWIQGGNASSGTGWTAELYHDGNTKKIPDGTLKASTVSAMSITRTGENITRITEDSVQTNIAYNADGTINAVSYPVGSKTRTETFTYSSGQLTGMTASEV